MCDSAVFKTVSSVRQTIPLLLHQYSKQTQVLNILSSKSVNTVIDSIAIQVQLLQMIKICIESFKLTPVQYMSTFCLTHCNVNIYVSS